MSGRTGWGKGARQGKQDRSLVGENIEGICALPAIRVFPRNRFIFDSCFKCGVGDLSYDHAGCLSVILHAGFGRKADLVFSDYAKSCCIERGDVGAGVLAKRRLHFADQ